MGSPSKRLMNRFSAPNIVTTDQVLATGVVRWDVVELELRACELATLVQTQQTIIAFITYRRLAIYTTPTSST